MTRVEVPPEFHAAGFGGDFWLDVRADTPRLWRRLVPCLLANSGWMALRVNNDDTVTVVRQDAAAIWETFTSRPQVSLTPILPITVSDWVIGVRYTVAHRLGRDGDGRLTDVTLCGRTVSSRITRARGDAPRCLACQRKVAS